MEFSVNSIIIILIHHISLIKWLMVKYANIDVHVAS